MLYTFCGITFFLAYFINTEEQRYHEFGLIESCTGSPGSNEVLFVYETEVAAYMDLEEKELVLTVPDIVYDIPGVDVIRHEQIDASNIELTYFCQDVYAKALSIIASETFEPPWTIVYPRNDVKLNVNNTLICHVTGFFPPPVRVSWTKNNVNVTEKSTVSRYYPNKDRKLNLVSRLSFIPEEGDIYICSVEHKTLQQPQTRTWDVPVKKPSIGPSVLCGVGLALGLLGLATGIFFIAKGKKWI